MTNLQSFIAELEKLEKEATPVPWSVTGCRLYFSEEGQFAYDKQDENAQLIAHSRNALPKLLQCLKVLSEACEHVTAPTYPPNGCCDKAYLKELLHVHYEEVLTKATIQVEQILGGKE